MKYYYFDSPLGKLLLAGNIDGLALISFPQAKIATEPHESWELAAKFFDRACKQLDEFFSGRRHRFDLPYILTGTEFQKRTLRAVADIPYGCTKAYSSIAQEINSPLAVRAVGMANARNKLPIIIPCHRVIGKNGSLTGFGGGLAAKTWLLELEQKFCHSAA